MKAHTALFLIEFYFFVVQASDFPCTDYVFQCAEYTKKGWCAVSHKHHDYMKNMCPQSCGFCGNKATTNPPTPTTVQQSITTRRPVITTEARTLQSTVAPGPCSLPDIANGRVIAGSDAKFGQFPWQVAIYTDGYFICGGSIISPEWVVTAAHCLWDLQPTNNVTVVAGDLDRSTLNGYEQVSELEIPHIHPHYYEPIRLNNDVALMKLKTPFKLGKYVQTICLPQQEEHLQPGSKCYLSGWGKTSKDGEANRKLQFVTLYSVNHTQCEYKNYRISDRMFCGFNPDNLKAAGCNGDSGGPLVCQGTDGGWKLHGVVSWGSTSCDTRYKFTVFSKMSAFRYFINDSMGLIKKATLPPAPAGGCNGDSSGAAYKYSMTSNITSAQTCGIPNPLSGRVIAGQKSKPGQFPWQVALYKRNWISSKQIYETSFQCGGSIIAPQWVLTAAHCVYRSYAFKFNVSIGVIDRSKHVSEQIIPVEKIITFPEYKRPVALNNDVALLKLRNPIKLGPLANTICLPNQGEKVAVGSKCFVSGWGKTETEPFVVDQLRHASLQILSNEDCYKRQWRINEVTDKMVCAAVGKGCPQSACQGDSGGPLVCQLPSGRWIQHGIVSWGSPFCDTNEASSVFSRVSEFRDWIEEMKIKYD